MRYYPDSESPTLQIDAAKNCQVIVFPFLLFSDKMITRGGTNDDNKTVHCVIFWVDDVKLIHFVGRC